MTFENDSIDDFIAIFKKYRTHIKSAPGCNSVKLLQDKKDSNIFFTYSYWESESFLNDYKNSVIFGEVWPQTKKLFSNKPEVWSVNEVEF